MYNTILLGLLIAMPRYHVRICSVSPFISQLVTLGVVASSCERPQEVCGSNPSIAYFYMLKIISLPLTCRAHGLGRNGARGISVI